MINFFIQLFFTFTFISEIPTFVNESVYVETSISNISEVDTNVYSANDYTIIDTHEKCPLDEPEDDTPVDLGISIKKEHLFQINHYESSKLIVQNFNTKHLKYYLLFCQLKLQH